MIRSVDLMEKVKLSTEQLQYAQKGVKIYLHADLALVKQSWKSCGIHRKIHINVL